MSGCCRLSLAGSGGCSEQRRGSARACWERKGLVAAAGPLLPATPVRHSSGRGLRVFHKRKFLPRDPASCSPALQPLRRPGTGPCSLGPMDPS